MADDRKSPDDEHVRQRRRRERRAPFFEAIARAEFGRNYWGEDDEEELCAARTRRRKHQGDKDRKGR